MSELAKRVRAARGYAGISQRELAARLGVDDKTVKRTEAGQRDPKPPELNAIAEICGLPRAFFTEDLTETFRLAAERNEQLLAEAEHEMADAAGGRHNDEALPAGQQREMLTLRDALEPLIDRLDRIAAAVGAAGAPSRSEEEPLEEAARAAEEMADQPSGASRRETG